MADVPDSKLPPPTTYRGVLFRLNTRWHHTALVLLLSAVAAWWLLQVWNAIGPASGAAAAAPLARVMVIPELLEYLVAFSLAAGLWALRTGFRGRAARGWMVAFWVQFVDQLEHAARAGLAILDRGLAQDISPVGPLELILPYPLLHALLASLVLSAAVAAYHAHVRATPEEAIDHNCNCASAPARRAGVDRGHP